MGFSSRMQKVATKLLSKFDESDGRIKLVRAGEKTWNEVTGEYDYTEPQVIDLVGVTVPFSQDLINEKTILTGDVQVKVTASELVTMNDKIQIDGQTWSIVDEPLVSFSGITIMYQLHCRK